MTTIGEILYSNGDSISVFEKKLLLSHVLGLSNEKLNLTQSEKVGEKDIKNFEQLINRRKNSEPIAYLTNIKSFWKNDFYVDQSVLIPRSDSELLIESVIEYFPDLTKTYNFLDLGSGSGCLIISLLNEYLLGSGTGVEIDKKAIKVSEKNKEFLLNKDRLKFLERDFSNFDTSSFDIVISNPPYISFEEKKDIMKEVRNYEPSNALFADEKGLYFYRKIIENLAKRQKRKQFLFFEVGINQPDGVVKILKNNNFKVVSIKKDISNIPRCIIAERS
jgi:release factor glutamine methyltransferase